MIARRGFSKKEVMQMSGLTRRQVQFYTESGIVIPEVDKGVGRGKVRRYSVKNISEFRMIKKLLTLGVNLTKMREFIRDPKKLDDCLIEVLSASREFQR